MQKNLAAPRGRQKPVGWLADRRSVTANVAAAMNTLSTLVLMLRTRPATWMSLERTCSLKSRGRGLTDSTRQKHAAPPIRCRTLPLPGGSIFLQARTAGSRAATGELRITLRVTARV